VNLSVRRLEQLFREETGLTYIAFRRRVRMKLAEKLLRSSSKPINEVTSMVGYKAAEYFCREFKKTRGCTATRFRRNVAKKSVSAKRQASSRQRRA
jgi:AraC-like DNA-binding protein